MTTTTNNRDEFKPARKARARKAAAPKCEWFLRCTNAATGTTPHPVLGEVPTCDRCHTFATGEHRS